MSEQERLRRRTARQCKRERNKGGGKKNKTGKIKENVAEKKGKLSLSCQLLMIMFSYRL